MLSELPDPLPAIVDVLVTRPAAVVLILVGAIALRIVARRLIARLVRHTRPVSAVLGRSSKRRDQRAKSIASLLGSIATFVIGAIAVTMALDVYGVNVAPLLTGAGIVGVALAFGAQTLVKDFIAGIFLVLEDQVGVGDEVTMGDTMGIVEVVGLRVTRLRDKSGTVWYVRNGDIVRVGNHSQKSGPA